ncbi:EAL domain-containing protein [Motilibacter deserti]|uniref:EAL domain-containing protein n=1 Tax=Motilibacter deserti TaxID=2714956 RepID=A0ABX0H0X5_9ACTN|nr:EAL domain-containing protein [Motilibacter deserti]
MRCRARRAPRAALRTGLGADRVDTAITTTIFTLAKALDLTVVAEGVERQEQVDQLRGLGCDLLRPSFSKARSGDEAGHLPGRPVGGTPSAVFAGQARPVRHQQRMIPAVPPADARCRPEIPLAPSAAPARGRLAGKATKELT